MNMLQPIRIQFACMTLAIAVLGSPVFVSAERPDAPQLTRLPVPAHLVEAVATRMNLRYHDAAGVTISPDDAAGGGLLVLAPPSLQPRIVADAKTIAAALGKESASAGTSAMTRHLIHITWREIEDIFMMIAGDVSVTTSRNGERASFRLPPLKASAGPTLVEVDRRLNAITLTSKVSMHNSWRQVLEAVDAPLTLGHQVHVHQLRQAESAPVQRAVRLLRQLETSHRVGKPTTAKSTRNAANFQTAAFQSDAAAPGQANQDGDAADAGDDDGGGVIGETDIQFIPESGLIILKGNQRDLKRIRDVIDDIERLSELTRPEVEVKSLQHADATAVATLLTQLYEDVLSARQGEVSITALDSPNAVLLIGRKEAVSAVLDLIAKIDQPIAETDRLRVYRLQYASALDAEETIRTFFSNRPGSDDDVRPGLGVRVRITADYRTNSLIVSASPRDLAEVTRLIEELDVQDIPATSEIRVFTLSNARAEDLVVVLQDSLTSEPDDTAGDTTAASSSLSIVSLGDNANSVLDSGVLTGTVITADAGANSVVVRAPSAGMPLIAELIRQLDQAPGIDSLVKVFTIENGDAAQLTTALQTLFGDDASTDGTSVGAGNLTGLPALTASESALVPLRFSTDVRTNSIIVSGSAEDLEVVESILLRLDSTGFAERITEVIWLKHQVADNIASAIQTYVQQRQQFQNIIPQYQQGLGPFDLPDRDVVVVAEAQTNSLLISVSPRLYEEVRRLIDRLDRRPPMVLIKTLIAEVVLEDGFEVGGEFGLQDSILFDRGKAVTPTTVATPTNDPVINGSVVPSVPGFNFGGTSLPNNNSFDQSTLASQGLTAFGVGASQLGVTGAQGFVFSAASDSVNMLLRTLRTANRLQILSRPEVMTADNTEGFVNVGQLFPRPTEITQNVQGQTLIGIEDVTIGLILRVTPRVGADGLIAMAIDATRSDVSSTDGQAIGTFDDGTPIVVPAIDQTTAQSTITAFDGQTVVFGGLITKQRENTSRRVPYLADIPLLGTFFKYDLERELRTELLIVMTPTLVTGDEDLEYVKQVESSRMSWCLADVVEAHGDVGLSGGYGLWGPAVGPTIYPDVHPTVDVFPASDLPGGPRAVHAGGMWSHSMDGHVMGESGMISSESDIPHGINLAPGESIVSPPVNLSSPGSLIDSSIQDSIPAPIPAPVTGASYTDEATEMIQASATQPIATTSPTSTRSSASDSSPKTETTSENVQPGNQVNRKWFRFGRK
ncbi:MAG: secretin N-terminal domain-containing protein [Planctomycetota bacterium]